MRLLQPLPLSPLLLVFLDPCVRSLTFFHLPSAAPSAHSPQVGQKKKRADVDLRSSTLASVSAEFARQHKQTPPVTRSVTAALADRDPITLEPLAEALAVFTAHVGGAASSLALPTAVAAATAATAAPVPCGGGLCSVRYDAVALARYMCAVGDFCEPTTRQPLGPAQLERLDALATPHGAPSCVASQRDRQAAYTAARERRDMVEGLERCLGEVVAAMLEEVRAAAVAVRKRPFSATAPCRCVVRASLPSRKTPRPLGLTPPTRLHLCSSLVAPVEQVDKGAGDSDECDPLPLVARFHEFDHYLAQLAAVDAPLCRQCLVQYIELSRGPKNKRRSEAGGLLGVMVGFLNEKNLAVTRVINAGGAGASADEE